MRGEMTEAANGLAMEFTSTAGHIVGMARDATLSFRGIPYAAQPVGPRRFQAAEFQPGWSGTLDATRYPASAMQFPVPGREEFFAWLGNTTPNAEACLGLNIYAPAPAAEPLPVLVYLHGGGFAFGSSSAPVLDGHQLARTGKVVVVTINHRLNIFGFLGTRRFAEEGIGTPNAGILDLVCALQWIQAHCASFGGDPSRVTIMGQSGGAGKVAMLMMAPAAKGLFHRAIIQSTATAFHLQDPQVMDDAFTRVLARSTSGGTVARALMGMPAETILACGREVVASFSGFDPFRPSMDGTTLPGPPGLSSRVPVLIGHTRDEANFYLLDQIRQGSITGDNKVRRITRYLGIAPADARAMLDAYTRRYPQASEAAVFSKIVGDHTFKLQSLAGAEFLVDGGLDDVYAYEFAYETARSRPYVGVPHTIELPFVFGNLDVAHRLIENPAEAAAISRAMMECWIAFASTGKPACGELEDWPRFDRAARRTMVFDRNSRVVSDPDAFERRMFAGIGRYLPGAPMTFVAD